MWTNVKHGAIVLHMKQTATGGAAQTSATIKCVNIELARRFES